MISGLPSRIFVSGTDTDVGKTVVSAILTLGLNASYWKPIQSGADPSTDGAWLKSVGVPEDQILPETHKLSHPLSPHRAAELDGKQISLSDFKFPDHNREHLLVEGAGGLLVPLNEKDLVIDLIKHLQLPVLLVCRSGLGTINHTLLSIEALRKRDIELLGVVMNGGENPSNRKAIEHYGQTRVLAEIPRLRSLTRESLLACYQSFAEEAVAG